MLKISVQVLNYNGKHHLRECYESLAHQTYTDVAVILVDNGSNDDSVRFTKENFPWVETIAFAKNLGFAKAYNEAMKKAATDYVALLNNDTRVEERWLEELVKVMEEDERIIAVGSKMLLYDNPSLLNHAGAKITPIGGGYDVGLFKSELLRINKRKVGAVCGGAMLVRKNLFLRIGGFDESFFAYFEDTDWCLRVKQAGWNIYFTPSAQIIHHGASSTKQVRREMRRESHRSLTRFYKKHYRDRLFSPVYWLILAAIRLNEIIDFR